jgi:hypothetical protein
MKKTGPAWLFLVAGMTAMVVSGCSGSKNKATAENFQAALNTYFANRSQCLFPIALHFPYEVDPSTSPKVEQARMDALMHAALLKREADKSIHVYIYSLTPAGERATSSFCYGHRQITSIDHFTPPAKANGFLETQVSYHYTVTEVPVWAKTKEIQDAFPELEKALAGNATGKTTLANAGAGWQVPE